jgi:cytosine/adenosine deaminase-related metal-dependent hydrolase
LRIDDRLGSIERGKAASFVIFDLQSENLHPTRNLLASLVTRADASDIAAVVHHGFVVSGEIPRRERVPVLPDLKDDSASGIPNAGSR